MREPPIDICPMLAVASIGSTSGPAVCIRERCAWWDPAGSECAIAAIASAVRDRNEQ